MSSVTNLSTTTTLDNKINEIKGEIPNKLSYYYCSFCCLKWNT